MKKNGKLIAIIFIGIFMAMTLSLARPVQDPADQTGFQFLDRLVVLLVKAVAPVGRSGVGLAILSDAIMSEVVSLHIHLENLSRRPEILKSYMEKSLKGIGAGE